MTNDGSQSTKFGLRIRFTVNALDADEILSRVVKAFDEAGVSYDANQSKAVQVSPDNTTIRMTLRDDGREFVGRQEEIENILAGANIKAFNLLSKLVNV